MSANLPPYPPAVPPYPPPAGPPPNSSKAITALVLGIVGIAACQLVGIAAIVVGNQAKEEIARSGGRLGGDGLAKAGVILGWVAVGLMGLSIVFFLLFFGVAAVTSS